MQGTDEKSVRKTWGISGKEISNFEFRAMPKKSLMDVRKVEQNLIDLAGGIKRGERNPNLHNLINSIRKG